MRPSRWIPGLAGVLFLFTLLDCLFMFDGSSRLFRDSDTGWHIRSGERIVEGRGVPRTDPYSFTKAGEPWFAWEWAADAVFGLAHKMGGLRGVAAVAALAIAASTWLWVRLQWRCGCDFLLTCGMASLMLSTVNLHWLARPHVFSWPLLVGVVLWAERRCFSRGAFVVLCVGSAVWANVHGSFLMAPAVLAAYAVGAWVQPWIGGLKQNDSRMFLAAAGVSLVSTLVNPSGWLLHSHVVKYLADGELLARVGEFQSFNFHVEGSGQILATLMMAMAGAVLALMRRRVDHALIMGALVCLALRSARGLPLVALVALPLAGGAITATVDGWRGAPLARWLGMVRKYSNGLRRLDAGMNGWVPVAVMTLLVLVAIPQAGFAREEFPVDAAAVVPAGGRVLATDKYGGYLIYRFDGARKVFFDGRSDFYGAEFMKRYIRLMELRPGWKAEMARWQFTHALLPVTAPLSAALEDAGWMVRYRDQVAVLLVAP